MSIQEEEEKRATNKRNADHTTTPPRVGNAFSPTLVGITKRFFVCASCLRWIIKKLTRCIYSKKKKKNKQNFFFFFFHSIYLIVLNGQLSHVFQTGYTHTHTTFFSFVFGVVGKKKVPLYLPPVLKTILAPLYFFVYSSTKHSS